MFIFMLSTHRGSEDGLSLRLFRRGEYYDISHTLACSFILRGWAVESRYAETSAPENTSTAF